MPDSDRISIDNLTLAPDLSNNDVAPVVHTVNGVKSTYKATMTLLGTFLNKVLQYSADLTTSDKTIIGAINEINAGGGGGGAVILYGTSAPASSLGSDGNLYVQYTAGTGGASDVVDALYVKLDGEWCEISTKQVQSDWSQSDNTKVDYIKNKPTIPTNAEQLPITSGSSTNTKDYIDNVDSKLAYKTYSINNIDVYRWGNVVFFNIIAGTNSTDASGLIVSGGSNVIIKNGYRPVNNVNVLDTVSGNRMTFNADGTVWTGVVSQSGQTFRLSGCWITTDSMPT